MMMTSLPIVAMLGGFDAGDFNLRDLSGGGRRFVGDWGKISLGLGF